MQHLEMTRDVAARFHAQLGETFVMPDVKVHEQTMLIPGTDGAKMSKSKNNILNIFLPEMKLRMQVMGIETDSTPMEDPKDPDTCNVFAIFRLLASEKEQAAMRKNYEGGNYGYGHAKQALYELILEQFAEARERYNYYMNNLNEIDKALAVGAEKATLVASDVLSRVRSKLGY
jgi:tryptophanyl-tRNA synthetase